MQHEIGAAALQLGDHRHDRRDADAAGHKEVPLGRLGERKIVAWERGLDRVADPDLVMQPARAFAELLAQHRDAIAPPLGRVVPQRIIPPNIIAKPHPDMRPGGKARQVAPVRVDELVAVDVLGQINDRADAQLHGPLSAEPRWNKSPFG